MKKEIALILAVDKKGLIGIEDRLPWELPNDLKNFRKITTNKTVVMGRKTFESIGRPLPNRKNVILTTDTTFKHDNVTIYNNLEDLLQNEDNIFIIGGVNLASQLWKKITKIYLTRVEVAVGIEEKEGGVYIDKDISKEGLIMEGYRLEGVELNKADTNHKYDYTFEVYSKE